MRLWSRIEPERGRIDYGFLDDVLKSRSLLSGIPENRFPVARQPRLGTHFGRHPLATEDDMPERPSPVVWNIRWLLDHLLF